MRADIHGGQEHKRSVQGPDTEAQDLSPPNPHFPLATRGRSIQKCQFQTSEVRQEEEDAFTTPGETYLILSQTRTPTPSRPSIGLLFGAVRIVRVSPSTLKNRT